ncbi:MAG: alcohol dehydrogenase [Gammaproteobacteria bacterium]|nr:alcohol dehydrogenase [Gammaproteobacteria bacterium]
MISYQTAGAGEPLVRTETETPEPQGTEVLIKTVACGVCHSDIHMQDAAFDLGGGKSLTVGRPGQVLGHEIFGEVVAMGPAVTGAAIGDRRVVYPWIGCGDCPSCNRGEEHLCTPGQSIGVVKNGGFSDHVLVPDARYLFDKGEVSDSLAATYACSGLTAYSALKKVGDLGPGDHLVIIGAGGVGMMAIQIAQSVLNLDPIVVDIDDSKLQAVREMGIEHAFNSNDESAGKEIMQLTGGAYVAIDFVGAEASVNFGMRTLRKGGKIIIVGLFGGALNMPLPFIPMTARIIQGSYVGSLAEMAELMDLVCAGKVAPIQIEERPMEEVSDALADLKAGNVKGRTVVTT